jgi:Hsp70 protein
VQDNFKQWQLEARQPAAAPPLRPNMPFEGTTTSRDMFRGWQLPPSFPGIGLELFGDRMHTLIPRGCKLPYTGRHVFSTIHDDQTELCILIYSGDSALASENELLGQFDLTGLPTGPARSPQIEVSFHVSEDRVLSVVARDLVSSRQYQWLQNGRMLVRTLSPSVRAVSHGPGEAAAAAAIGATTYPSAAAAIAH